ncbi:hypothetical protein ACFCVO_12195 [Agromyces sp. NPDC056379]|uniref:hypothetical protein n=1 Tax=unclassified Agromyces TaxID=2639701 RepID=UPI0035E0F84D
MTRAPMTGAILTSAISILLLTGCASAGGATTSETTPVASPEMVEPKPSPTTEPADEPDPVLDCANILTAETYPALDERGFEARPDAESYPPPAGADLVAEGALECLWTAGDERVWIARLAESDELWNARVAGLAPSGWTAVDRPLPEALVRYPEFDEDLQPAIAHVDGVTYFAEPGKTLRSIAAIAGGPGS